MQQQALVSSTGRFNAGSTVHTENPLPIAPRLSCVSYLDMLVLWAKYNSVAYSFTTLFSPLSCPPPTSYPSSLKTSILPLLLCIPHPPSLLSSLPTLSFPLSLSDRDELTVGLGNPSCRIPHLNSHSHFTTPLLPFFPPLFFPHPSTLPPQYPSIPRLVRLTREELRVKICLTTPVYTVYIHTHTHTHTLANRWTEQSVYPEQKLKYTGVRVFPGSE